MTPEAAVALLFDIIATRTEFTEMTVYTAMCEAGVPSPAADRAYKFTQIACGRALLSGLGVSFSPEYSCFSGAGEVLETGRLADEPYFAAATGIVNRYIDTPGFEQLALMGGEVYAINEWLNMGSKPEDLVPIAPFMFMEDPTSEGMERARQHLLKGLDHPKKPWWRFW